MNTQNQNEIVATIESDEAQSKREARADLLNELAGFSGSMEWHRFCAFDRRHLLTDGAHYLAEKAGAFWLMDVIASYQGETKFIGEDFQVWKIMMDAAPGQGCVVYADDGNGNELARQAIEYTDFPDLTDTTGKEPEPFKLFAQRNELGGVTIMLPSEN